MSFSFLILYGVLLLYSGWNLQTLPISLNSADVSLHIKLCLTEQRRGPNLGGWPSSRHGTEGTQTQVDLCTCSFLLVIMWTFDLMSEPHSQGDTTSAIHHLTGSEFVIVTVLLTLFPEASALFWLSTNSISVTHSAPDLNHLPRNYYYRSSPWPGWQTCINMHNQLSFLLLVTYSAVRLIAVLYILQGSCLSLKWSYFSQFHY